MVLDRDNHPTGGGLEGRSLVAVAPQPGDSRKLVGRKHELSSNEERLRDPSFSVLGGLEGLTGALRKAVQVEAVVPIGATDER